MNPSITMNPYRLRATTILAVRKRVEEQRVAMSAGGTEGNGDGGRGVSGASESPTIDASMSYRCCSLLVVLSVVVSPVCCTCLVAAFRICILIFGGRFDNSRSILKGGGGDVREDERNKDDD